MHNPYLVEGAIEIGGSKLYVIWTIIKSGKLKKFKLGQRDGSAVKMLAALSEDPQHPCQGASHYLYQELPGDLVPSFGLLEYLHAYAHRYTQANTHAHQ